MDYATSKHRLHFSLDVFSLHAINAKQMTVSSTLVIQTPNQEAQESYFFTIRDHGCQYFLRRTVRNANFTYTDISSAVIGL